MKAQNRKFIIANKTLKAGKRNTGCTQTKASKRNTGCTQTKARKRKHESTHFGNHQQIILSPQPQNLINEHANYLSTM